MSMLKSFLRIAIVVFLNAWSDKAFSEAWNNKCVSTTFISCGELATQGQFPGQVAILHNGSKFCSGIAVNSQWVLTAAHCLYDKDIKEVKIIFGSVNIIDESRTNLDTQGEVFYDPGNPYNRVNEDNDIALIKLRSQTPFSPPALSFFTFKDDDDGLTEDAKLTVSGWGNLGYGNTASNMLMFGRVNYVPKKVCENLRGGPLTKSMVCAGGYGGPEACDGDSGGPLFKGSILVGLVSYGSGCHEEGAPTVYSRVSLFQDWISNLTRIQ